MDLKNEYKNNSKQLYSTIIETLKIKNTRQRMFVPGEYIMITRGDSKRQCFGTRVYNQKMVEAEALDGSLLIERG